MLSTRGVRASLMLDLSLLTCQMGRGRFYGSAGLQGLILLCTCPPSLRRLCGGGVRGRGNLIPQRGLRIKNPRRAHPACSSWRLTDSHCLRAPLAGLGLNLGPGALPESQEGGHSSLPSPCPGQGWVLVVKLVPGGPFGEGPGLRLLLAGQGEATCHGGTEKPCGFPATRL